MLRFVNINAIVFPQFAEILSACGQYFSFHAANIRRFIGILVGLASRDFNASAPQRPVPKRLENELWRARSSTALWATLLFAHLCGLRHFTVSFQLFCSTFSKRVCKRLWRVFSFTGTKNVGIRPGKFGTHQKYLRGVIHPNQ